MQFITGDGVQSWKEVEHWIQNACTRMNATGEPIPLNLQRMLISAEDHRFLIHPGVDSKAVVRAAWRTVLGKREGGSTIAQQLVRVATGRFERTISRKLDEMRLASQLTARFSKREIPAIYLSVAYYGWRMNGLSEARDRLKLDLGNFSNHDAAGLVARLKYPEPRIAPEARKRQIQVRTEHIMMLYERHWTRRELPGLI
jgi:membrane peptidoglycan carboxypeptidase